jgi:hypothetical protein
VAFGTIDEAHPTNASSATPTREPTNVFFIAYVFSQSDRTSTESTEQVQEHQNDQYHTDYPDTPTPTPSPISVIATAAAEQEHQNNDQQNQ